MKGATPVGPKISIATIATANAAPRARAGQRPSSSSNELRHRGGINWPASPRNKTKQTGAVAKVAAPGTLSWLNTENAISNDDARKKTHPTQTALNSRIRAIHRHAADSRQTTS